MCGNVPGGMYHVSSREGRSACSVNFHWHCEGLSCSHAIFKFSISHVINTNVLPSMLLRAHILDRVC